MVTFHLLLLAILVDADSPRFGQLMHSRRTFRIVVLSTDFRRGCGENCRLVSVLLYLQSLGQISVDACTQNLLKARAGGLGAFRPRHIALVIQSLKN